MHKNAKKHRLLRLCGIVESAGDGVFAEVAAGGLKDLIHGFGFQVGVTCMPSGGLCGILHLCW